MTETIQSMPLMISLLFLLVLARLGGEIMERMGQPAMIGEIAAGILLGPSLLDKIHMTPELQGITELGVFLLVLLAGMEMDPREIQRAFQGRGRWVAVLGFTIPLLTGLGIGAAFEYDPTRSLFLGLCIAITALPVSVRILMDLGKLHTDTGRWIISAAVFNDVLALLVLGVILDVRSGDGGAGNIMLSIFTTTLKASVFVTAVLGISRLVRYSANWSSTVERGLEWLVSRLRGKEAVFAITLGFVLVFASFSEAMGLHFVVGAFFGAMLLSREILGPTKFEEVKRTASSVTMGFLAPIFFAGIGLEFRVLSMQNVAFVATILVAAFASKILGGYLGGRLAGAPSAQSWALGCGLNARGIMELVIANIALAAGFIDTALFSTLVLMGIVTTMATPILLKWAFARQMEARQEEPPSNPEQQQLPLSA
jgi:Kef-type K+ transport system membrane component KefB